MIQPLWKTVWWFLTKLNVSLPYHPGILLPGIYLKELKIYMHTKTCSWMFIATLSIIVKTCNESRCPSVGEWINCGITHMYSFTQLCLTLCDPMDCSPPGSSVHEIFQARILEWVAISSSRGSSWPRNETHVSCIGRHIYHWTIWKASLSAYRVIVYDSPSYVSFFFSTREIESCRLWVESVTFFYCYKIFPLQIAPVSWVLCSSTSLYRASSSSHVLC